MNTKQLRQKILDLAIRGKLVPQDSNDEPASKLLERIRAEKEQLIKDKKIKRDKNESYIFVGDDKLHYEKFADGSIVCIEDEIPFEIPETWAWVRLKDVSIINPKNKADDNTEAGFIPMPLISKNYLESVMFQKKTWNEIKKGFTHFQNNDVVVAKITPCFENSKAAIISNLPNNLGAGTTELHVIRPIKILPEYVYAIAKTKQFLESGKQEMTGCAGQQRVPTSFIEDYLIPIPPINEQQRITQTIKELLNLVETLECNKLELTNLIKQTKSKVLDLAIRGKLTPQDPNDEPADKLLEEIREEREKLIKESKLKRDKNETFIYKNSDDNSYYEQIDEETVCIDDDLPFEIPDSWRWTKFGNICNIARGGSPRPIETYLTNDKNGINWIKISDTEKGGKYIYSTKEKIKPEGISKSRYVKAGDFLLTNSMSFGRPYILKTDGCIHDGWLVINDDFKVFCQDFLYYLLSSNIMYQLLSIAAQGSTVKNLKLDTVKNVIIPIPPLNEQIKISKKIVSVFNQLDTIQEIFNK